MWRRGSLRGLGSRRAASHRYRRKTSPQPTRPRRRRYPISRQSGGHHVWGGGQSPPRGISYSRLIHDDVVGSDEIRRGEKTFAHSLTSAANSAHLGQSLAVLAGDLAIAEVIDLLNDPDVSPQLRAPATRIVINAITESAHGEIADVAFRTTESPHTIDDVRADTLHDAWRVFIWANYIVGAVVCVTLVWVFAKG